jgi:hypothetical protein
LIRPSKKIIYLAVGALVIVIVIFIYKNHTRESVLGEKSLSYEAAGTSQTLPPPDADGDGLSDYQETSVWHTNPNNPDTDGDGTNDGDEVNTNRDPAKPGPDDGLSPGDARITAAIQNAISGDTSGANNFTQNLSKNFFTSYLSAQDESGGVADNDRIKLIQGVVTGTASTSVAVEKYGIEDLNVVDTTDKTQIKSYANVFALIYKNNLTAYQRIQEPDYEQTADYYQNLSRELLRLRVPREIADVQLSIINSYDQMHQALVDLVNYDADPVKGLLALQTYKNNNDTIATFYLKIADYLKKNGIIFTKDEPGFLWSGL